MEDYYIFIRTSGNFLEEFARSPFQPLCNGISPENGFYIVLSSHFQIKRPRCFCKNIIWLDNLYKARHSSHVAYWGVAARLDSHVENTQLWPIFSRILEKFLPSEISLWKSLLLLYLSSIMRFISGWKIIQLCPNN